MKKVLILFALLLLNFALSYAEPLKKPSPETVKQLIKEMVLKSKTTIFTGIGRATYPTLLTCENIYIEEINLLKIGRVASNYYERGGSYINSGFKVKFLIKGTCDLSRAYRLNEHEYSKYTYLLKEAKRHNSKKPTPVMPMDLSGTIPFRNDVAFEVSILTDDYGDWYASEYSNAFKEEDRCFSDKTAAYLQKLFTSTHQANIKKWEQAQINEKNRLSDEAESGKNLIKYNRLFTKEVKMLLDAQPKRIREFVYRGYWEVARKESHKSTQRFRKTDLFLKEVIKQMKLRK